MDSENEDVLEIGVGDDDIAGMELDDPIVQQPLRVGQERNDQAPSVVTEVTEMISAVSLVEQKISETPKTGSMSSVAEEAKKKKRKLSKNPAVRERWKKRRKEQRARWRQRVRETLKSQVATATQGVAVEEPVASSSLSPLDDTIKRRTYYEEWLPSSIGTYYRAGPAPVVRNLLPPGYYSSSDSDDFAAEEVLEPEDRPWMKGHKKPLALPPAALEPQTNSEGVELLERQRQRYYESPSIRMAKYAIRDKWKLAEREILIKDQREIKFPRQLMPEITIGKIREALGEPKRFHLGPSSLCHNYMDRAPAQDRQWAHNVALKAIAVTEGRESVEALQEVYNEYD